MALRKRSPPGAFCWSWRAFAGKAGNTGVGACKSHGAAMYLEWFYFNIYTHLNYYVLTREYKIEGVA